MRTPLVVALAVVLVAGGCDGSEPTVEPSSPAPTASPDPSAAAIDLLFGEWRPVSLPVDQGLAEAMAFVCANAADQDLKAVMEHVPVALVDARGDGLVSVILADDHVAFECRLKLETIGSELTSTIIGAPARLDPGAIAPVEDTALSVVSHTRVEEDAGSRTILIGRVGPKAYRVVAAFDDESEVTASKDNGWFYAWWPGTVGLGGIASLDNKSLVQSAVNSPADQIEGRVGPAAWWVDPAAPPGPDATTISGLIRERACASGQSPEGRILQPAIFSSETAFLISVFVRQPAGAQDCPGNPAVPLEIALPEPLGQRRLLDGSEVPPRDASVAVP
ncbi:MAG TPA: hypothetical protein VFO73_13015 [Candidatus Limnocylindrales bacterium]|nr:hypothetical protein [Candidatus Limnocylindrales bacterium]